MRIIGFLTDKFSSSILNHKNRYYLSIDYLWTMLKTRGKYFVMLGLLVLAFVMTTTDVDAQCAMCRAVAEDAIEEDGYGMAMGLNGGILFIMSVPYVLLTVGFLVFYRTKIVGFLKAFNNIHR